MLKIQLKFHLCAQVKKGLHCTDFHKTHFCCWYCVGVFCTKFRPYVLQNMENLGGISYLPFGKV